MVLSLLKPELNTVGIGAHTTPTVISSFVKFVLYRRKRKSSGKPTAQLSYAEGLAVVKKFLEYASAKHSVGELQAFTGHKVPTPNWVVKEVVHLPQSNIDRAAQLIRKQLKKDGGLEKVGGDTWWTMRGRDLMCEWIEVSLGVARLRAELTRREQMKKQRIKRGDSPPEKVLLYIHGESAWRPVLH